MGSIGAIKIWTYKKFLLKSFTQTLGSVALSSSVNIWNQDPLINIFLDYDSLGRIFVTSSFGFLGNGILVFLGF